MILRVLVVAVLVVSASGSRKLFSAAFQSFTSSDLNEAPATDHASPKQRYKEEENEDSLSSQVELNPKSSRRSFLTSSLATVSSLAAGSVGGKSALAANDVADTMPTDEPQSAPDNRKPYAPLENLLPATRVKVLIDDAVDTVTQLKDNKDDETKLALLLAQLKSLLLEPHEFFQTKQETSTSRNYLNQQTWKDWKRARQEETRQYFDIQTDPATQLNEAFEQWGERRQFKRLRRQQLALEESNKMRAAFNAYTNNLVFGEAYTLNASPAEKKRLIRLYDQLPDVTSVIRSDLDLRDLYRNEVLTAMDDAKAELEYQLRASNGDESTTMDFTELLSILRQAQTSCSEWFNFVPEKDLKKALDIVNSEQQ